MSTGNNIKLNYRNLGIISLIWSAIFPAIIIFSDHNYPLPKFIVLLLLSILLEIVFIAGGIYFIQKR